MATFCCSVLYSILLTAVSCYAAAADSLFPFLPPFSGNNGSICPPSVCGRGNCVASNHSVVGFACRCDPGWTQPFDDGPCIIPNCTLNLNCGNPPAPAPASRIKPNSSFFDLCHWTDCGGGTCNSTSPFTHRCECHEGYFNLFNSSTFPCYRQCSFGVGCDNLGIPIANSSNRSPPPRTTSNALRLAKRTSFFGLLITWMSALALLI